MRLLIDTNLAITYATGREKDPDKDATIAVIDMCAEGKAEGYLAIFLALKKLFFTNPTEFSMGPLLSGSAFLHTNSVRSCSVQKSSKT